ncbi:MAG: class I SAM-dependent methyltransferase [Proteobacteria bacterium]|nr:class I SAM-dependent methyltransferase [Pseudomonadota bacterium]
MLAETEILEQEQLSGKDAREAEAFMERTAEMINAGAETIMISIGHRSGLFDVMAVLGYNTSQEIANSASLAERYVREWLAVMVTAGIVLYEPNNKTYHLPKSHAACLTRGAEMGNMAVYAQFIPMMGAVQEHTLQCLESGGGTNYHDYPCFHKVMSEDSEQSVVSSLFDVLLPLINGIDEQLHTGINVLDAGCGKGLALIALAQHYPHSHFIGYDLSEEAIAEATHLAQTRNLNNIEFAVKDLYGFNESEQYDLITSFDAIHDQRDPQGLVKGIQQALRPSGVYLMQDIGGSAHLENNMDFPMASLLYTISCTHCTPISIGQGGEGLGTMWGWETAQTMLENAGLTSIERHVLPHDPMNVWFVSRKLPSND